MRFQHEMGHAFATRNLGGTVDRIVLWPLGGFSAVLGPLHGVVSDELWVSIAGPITHIFQGGFWVAIYAAVEKGDFSNFTTSINLNNLRSEGFQGFMSALCVQAIVGNLILFVFNLAIPAFPLDGGRALLALLVMGEVKIQAAAKITGATGFISGVALLVVGIYFYLANTSAGALFLVLIGMFLVHFGLQLLKHVAANRLSEHPLCCRDCYHELLGVRTVNNGSQDVSEVSQERRRRPYGAYEIS
jgi:Zn-dependent protease